VHHTLLTLFARGAAEAMDRPLYTKKFRRNARRGVVVVGEEAEDERAHQLLLDLWRCELKR